jgi:hypothetical protein
MLRAVSFALAALALAAGGCGGGDGGIGGTGTTAVVSTGVMTKGSVILNGVRYDDSRTAIRLDDVQAMPAALKTGMVVKLRGRINADGINGTAEKVEAENEVRGTVQARNAAAGTLTVNNQSVLVDDQTQFANITGLSDPVLIVGTSKVKVHGLRDGDGVLRATYLEREVLPGGVDSLKGTVASLSLTKTFVLRNAPAPGPTDVNVDYNAAPSPPSLVNGAPVQVHGSFNGATFLATRIDLEDEEDADFKPAPNEEFEVEGFVSGCGTTSPCTNFSVSGQAVEVDASTEFRDGAADDIADGVKVEVEGRISGTTLRADKVTFKRTRVRLEGVASAVDIANTPNTVTVFGIPVHVNSATHFLGTTNSLADIAPGDRVDIRGHLQSGGIAVAEQLREVGGGGPTPNDRIRGPVTSEVGSVLTILGVSVDLTTATEFQIEGSAVTLAQFLAAVTPASSSPPGTVVQAQGTFSGGIFTAEEAEIED